MNFILFNMIFFNSMLIFFMKTPLSMGFLILTQTLLICLFTGLIINSYWFSYILFLVFMGGMLILFIYVASIASNEIFFPSKILFFFMMLLILMIIIFNLYFLNKLNLTNFFFNLEMNPLTMKFLMINYEYKINVSKMYNNNMWNLMIMFILYLFITLVAVIKIINIYYGPLRSTMY